MRELRDDTFSKNKNENSIIMLIESSTLLTPEAVNTWDLFKKAFIQRNISNNSITDGLGVIVSKLDKLGRDMKKLKENFHPIQVGCQIIVKDPLARSFYDYKWVFDIEINQLADEYELRIGKNDICLIRYGNTCKDVHRDNTYWWHDHEFEKEECDEMEIEIEKYDLPKVQVETFKERKYSFKGGQKFVCMTKEEDDSLPLERRNRSRFKEMIQKEFDINTHDKT
nr:phospholipase-like protein [Tanacetum cinerariifolium]